MLALVPAYYAERYGLLGDPLSTTADFTCGPSGKFYICRPKRAEVTQQVVTMQKAIDAFLTRLPIFRTTDVPLVVNPIGSSGSGYDGRVGPVTSGVGEVALIGAAEMQRAAGEGDPPGNVVIAMRDFSAEKNRTENFARFAADIAAYLQNMVDNFDAIMARIRQRRAAEDLPVVVAPPPLPVPDDIKPIVKKKSSKGLILAAAAAAAGLMGLAAWKLRDADPHDQKVTLKPAHRKTKGSDFMGAPARRRRRR